MPPPSVTPLVDGLIRFTDRNNILGRLSAKCRLHQERPIPTSPNTTRAVAPYRGPPAGLHVSHDVCDSPGFSTLTVAQCICHPQSVTPLAVAGGLFRFTDRNIYSDDYRQGTEHRPTPRKAHSDISHIVEPLQSTILPIRLSLLL
jgi:hypothetical protein